MTMQKQLFTLLPAVIAFSSSFGFVFSQDIVNTSFAAESPPQPDDESTLLPAAWEASFAVASIVFVVALKKYHTIKKSRGASRKIDKLGYERKSFCEPECSAHETKFTAAARTLKQRAKKSCTGPSHEALKEMEEKAQTQELLHTLARKGDVYRASKTLEYLEDHFGNLPLTDYTCVITMHAKVGDPTASLKWLRRVQDAGLAPNSICFNAVINAYAKQGNLTDALAMVDEMKNSGVDFDTVTYNTLIDASARSGDAVRAQLWMKRMLAEGVKASVVSFGSVMRACARGGMITELEHWYDQADKLGIELNMICYSAVINAFVKNGDLDAGASWLTRMIKRGLAPSLQCFLGLLNALFSKGDVEFTVRVFEQLHAAKVQVDAGMYSSLVAMAAPKGYCEVAQNWADEAVALGLQLTRAAETALVDANLRVPSRDDESVTRRMIETVATSAAEEAEGDSKSTMVSKTASRRACVGKQFTGIIKEFISCKFGYIYCDETHAIFKRDVFLCCQDNPDQLAKGQRVTFTLQIDKQRGLPRACDVKAYRGQ